MSTTEHIAYKRIEKALKRAGNPEKAVFLKRFFKTGKGQYGYGDEFIGVTVPVQRSIARMYIDTPETALSFLLASKIHEYRLTALIILVYQFNRANPLVRKKIYNYYLSKTPRINNWDLVDASARDIVGEYLLDHPIQKTILYKLVKSENLWERRIAIVATWSFIRKNQFEDTLKLSQLLLKDTQDLIHKAVGWMLREVGKRDRLVLSNFLDAHAPEMPRTSLRYAIEHTTQKERLRYMNMRREA
ncbi:MAG TPA: DNA alkylation repair protein [Candidatus Magasanikbacteria bacterium]|nr:DNA alkylation repair protein [Candidatus Magasanikbacteria bacterium]